MSSSSTPRRANTGQLVQSERIHQLGQLVAGVIHELNNPLTIVNANLHVLDEYIRHLMQLIALYEAAGVSSPEITACAEEIDLPYLQKDLPRILSSCQEGANRARSLVDELRRFSSANSPEVGPVDLRGILNSTVRLVESSYRNRVEFKLEIDKLPPVMGITGQLQQVLMNLLINACQSIKERGVIHLRSRAEEGCAVIEVVDSGEGIPADVLPRIFEPYFSTKSPTDGTGLGLPISKRIVEKHGGRLDVVSVPGQGTTFTIVLPIEGNPALAEDPGSPYEL